MLVTYGLGALNFGAAADPDDVPARINRLAGLAHEAFHLLTNNDPHTRCGLLDYLFREKFDAGIFRSVAVAAPDDLECDVGYKAYAAGAFVQETLAASCDCSPTDRARAMLLAARTMAKTVVPLQRPWTVPEVTALRHTTLPGRTFSALPAAPFFDIQLKATRAWIAAWDCEARPECKAYEAEAIALRDLVIEASEAQPGAGGTGSPAAFAAGWTVPLRPPVALDPAWPAVWVARAARSADTGYNVPLVAVTPCATSPIGCEPEWLAKVRMVEAGTRSAPFRLSAPGDLVVARVALPRGAFAANGPHELRVSLSETNGRTLAARLQCSGRSLTYTTDKQTSASREFLSDVCLLSVRPAGDTETAEFTVLVELAS
jgi:hypothetical protein